MMTFDETIEHLWMQTAISAAKDTNGTNAADRADRVVFAYLNRFKGGSSTAASRHQDRIKQVRKKENMVDPKIISVYNNE